MALACSARAIGGSSIPFDTYRPVTYLRAIWMSYPAWLGLEFFRDHDELFVIWVHLFGANRALFDLGHLASPVLFRSGVANSALALRRF